MFSQDHPSGFTIPRSISDQEDASPVLYSLQGALVDLAIVFIGSTLLFVPLVLTGASEALLAWADAYPRLNLTELFVYAILLTTGFSLASLRRWIQLTSLYREHQEAEQELLEQTQKLKRSNEELERFAYVASHDLREPLRTVHSHLSLLERDAGDDLPGPARESLDFARQGAARMDQMVKSLLSYARIERSEARTRPIDAEKAFEEALANLEATIKRADVEIHADELPWVWADHGELVLIFQNLLQNAVRHSRRPGSRVRIGGELDGDHARLWVEDEGPGVPKGQRERIFELFRQGSFEDREGGAGIGLTICKRVVERHGGEIWVEGAHQGSGARFVVELRGFE